MWSVLKKIERQAYYYSDKMVWSNVYGLARTLLASCTLLTLLFNSDTLLFGQQLKTNSYFPQDIGISRFSLFFMLRFHLPLAKAIAMVLLLLIASGWRPRFTCLLHWYIAYSFDVFAVVPDGGDQVNSVLTALLIPICLTDNRRFHWDKAYKSSSPYVNLFAYACYCLVRLQVALIYLDAATEKFRVEEWKNGTILWYLFNDPILGCNDFWKPLVIPLLKVPLIIALLTWSALVLELCLFLGLTAKKKHRQTLLIAGVSFHFLILLIHGLATFFLAMTAALILYLRDWNKEFKLENFRFPLSKKTGQDQVAPNVLHPDMSGKF